MKSTKSFAQILLGMECDLDRKLERKLPGWSGKGVVIPSALSLEQCSSSATAAYKAGLACERLGGSIGTVCDITGGLGSDAAAFARVADRLLYFEKNAALVEAARRNCSQLGIGNIEFNCTEVGPESVLPECDMIYADPARRDSSGRKLFRLEDCSPDIGRLWPVLLRSCRLLMVKVSPMADIGVLSACFGDSLREVHIVGSGGEVRELLCLIEKGNGRFRSVRVVELERHTGVVLAEFDFHPSDEGSATPVMADSITPGQYLLEPSSCMMKSGAFRLSCMRFGLAKLAPSTHLYLAGEGAALPPAVLFKRFVVEEVLPFSSRSFSELKSRKIKADASAKNIRMGSEELRTRTGCLPGGEKHLFGCMTGCMGAVLLLTRRLSGEEAADGG